MPENDDGTMLSVKGDMRAMILSRPEFANARMLVDFPEWHHRIHGFSDFELRLGEGNTACLRVSQKVESQLSIDSEHRASFK